MVKTTPRRELWKKDGEAEGDVVRNVEEHWRLYAWRDMVLSAAYDPPRIDGQRKKEVTYSAAETLEHLYR